MGDNALSGLLPGGSSSLIRFSEPQFDDKWSKSELIASRLIQGIQPSRHSEGKRWAIIEYVERLIQRNFNCQVSTYGSVPLKTYLPDGDIDLSTFSWFPHSSEVWANELRLLLKREEHNKHAKFCVKEVHVIHAEVQIVKCLVDNVIVDISFNQLGGICTLCFLEEVDRLIGQDHLFKRSIILVKAWCYYESRILGAHHGLISTYALETLVLYIFNIFHTSLRGPFEVLCKFLQFFSQFDWKHYCVGLGGPIRLTTLHDMTAAEPPHKERNDLLFSHDFLFKCTQVYGVPLVGVQDFQGRNFISKHMNVVDPLRVDNNLGRSVNRGNFFRICRAFAYGAKQIEKLLHGSPEELSEKLDEFFRNTKKYCNGYRPDAPTPRLIDVSVPMMASMTEEVEDAGVDSANQALSKSYETSQKASGNLTDAGSSGTNELSEEILETTLTTDKMPTKSWLEIENDRKLPTIHNEYSFSPAAVPSRREVSEIANMRMSKINFSNTNGVSMKANDSFPIASDMTKYNRGNIENARDLSSSENGCNGFHHEADSSAVMPIRSDLAMPSCMANEQPALQISNSTISSILTGDFGSYFSNLQVCRLMVASQFYAPITFTPPVMFPVQHMFEPYASEGPGRPMNADMNLFTQGFSHNYEQYLNPSFQGLSLQNAYGMPKSHRGTGTYLPNLRSGSYRDTQPTRSGRGGASSSKVPEWSGITNQDEAKATASKYSHVGARHEGCFGTNTRPEKRILPENGCILREEKLSKVPAAFSDNVGGTTLKFTSQVPEYKPFIARDMKTLSLQTDVFGPSSKNSDNGFFTESLEFGSLGSSFLGKSKKVPIFDGPRKDPDGSRSPNFQDLKNGNGVDSEELTAKKVLFNDNQQSRSYELKEEDFPPLSTSGQANKSTGLSTRKDSTIEWPLIPDSSMWTSLKFQQHVDN